ncbi:hypothetical protein J4Q44_G00256630 [Coregonus suidteri]|uniref:Uncharacterized protein n=1 Tax=Coregonus suidteri TaxID=861788 RepID=A0AAN8L7C6_9TELE
MRDEDWVVRDTSHIVQVQQECITQAIRYMDILCQCEPSTRVQLWRLQHIEPVDGTDRRRNILLSEVVTLDRDGDGGFGGPHKEEAGVPSNDVELTLDLVPVRMVFTEVGHLTSTTAVVPTRPSGEAPRIPDPVTQSPDSCTSIPVDIFNALMPSSSLSVPHFTDNTPSNDCDMRTLFSSDGVTRLALITAP